MTDGSFTFLPAVFHKDHGFLKLNLLCGNGKERTKNQVLDMKGGLNMVLMLDCQFLECRKFYHPWEMLDIYRRPLICQLHW